MVDEVATTTPRSIILACSLLAYLFITYFTTRENFFQFVGLYAVLFGAFIFLVKTSGNWSDIKIVIGASILFRLALIALTPNMSDDYFRFIWDGHMVSSGLNPFQYLPVDAVGTADGLTYELLNNLNSPQYFSVYPPVHQWIFGIATSVFPLDIKGAIMVMRFFVISADIGIIWIGIRLLKILELPLKNILWYAINPLVIIELTGNLHFEAVMLFLLLFSIFLLFKEKIYRSAIVFGLAVSTKLVPLIFLPILINYMGIKKGSAYVCVLVGAVTLSFMPFISKEMLLNTATSLDLYFRNFEFNASVYYVTAAVFKLIFGYNMIAFIGPTLGVLALIFILMVSLMNSVEDSRKLMIGMLFIATVYYLLSTTVHPWYISSLIVLTVFTRYRYAIAWSMLIVLSYFAYTQSPIEENVLLLWIEYGIVISFLVIEWKMGGGGEKNASLIRHSYSCKPELH